MCSAATRPCPRTNMIKSVVISACLAAICCREPVAQGLGDNIVHALVAGEDRVEDAGVFWRSARFAGANALYLMLWGNGLERVYADVAAAVAHGPSGTTVADLLTAGEVLGLELEALRVTPEAARSLPAPFVAHLDYGSSDYRRGGRFVVISRWGEGTCVACDAQTGLVEVVDAEELLRIWSGVVVARPGGAGSLTAVVAVALGALVMAALLALRSRYGRQAERDEAAIPGGAL